MISNIRRQIAGVRARFIPNGHNRPYNIGQFSMPILVLPVCLEPCTTVVALERPEESQRGGG
jgi:hypothetical protein